MALAAAGPSMATPASASTTWVRCRISSISDCMLTIMRNIEFGVGSWASGAQHWEKYSFEVVKGGSFPAGKGFGVDVGAILWS